MKSLINGRTILAMTTALLLAGSAATTASAYDRYSYDNDRYDNRYSISDRDCDGVNDRFDRRIRDVHDADSTAFRIIATVTTTAGIRRVRAATGRLTATAVVTAGASARICRATTTVARTTSTTSLTAWSVRTTATAGIGSATTPT